MFEKYFITLIILTKFSYLTKIILITLTNQKLESDKKKIILYK